MLDFGYYNIDCMEGMREFPDNYFELAIVDPPYGIGYDTQAEKSNGQRYKNAAAKKRNYHGGGWDVRPSRAYFDELISVSKRQVIWGGELLHRLFTGQSELHLLGQKMRRRYKK